MKGCNVCVCVHKCVCVCINVCVAYQNNTLLLLPGQSVVSLHFVGLGAHSGNGRFVKLHLKLVVPSSVPGSPLITQALVSN